jgi:hypothetical protein
MNSRENVEPAWNAGNELGDRHREQGTDTEHRY